MLKQSNQEMNERMGEINSWRENQKWLLKSTTQPNSQTKTWKDKRTSAFSKSEVVTAMGFLSRLAFKRFSLKAALWRSCRTSSSRLLVICRGSRETNSIQAFIKLASKRPHHELTSEHINLIYILYPGFKIYLMALYILLLLWSKTKVKCTKTFYIG